MSIFEYNGSAIVAMAGKNCVAIGSDLRFGVQLATITADSPKVGTPTRVAPMRAGLRGKGCVCVGGRGGGGGGG
jgi:hypothetical protein